MTIDMHTLPAEPVVPYTKPTLANTKGGKLYKPTHPDSFRVVFEALPGATAAAGHSGEGEDEQFSSKLVAVREYASREVIAELENLSAAPAKAYSSVQYGSGQEDHLELNSDLLFMNHSCAPTAEVHLPPRPSQWLVRAGAAGIPKGGDITFFYPSTEWDMAQGFECGCGAEKCLGRIQGAKHLTLEELEARGLVNEHIRELKAKQA